jgi:xanthine phosphoribosyltransferase
MQLLADRIQRDGKHLGNGVLKVDSFMNHQVDSVIMRAVGEEFAKRFCHTNPTKILTAETSGIAPALAAGMALEIPIIFARKHQPITMAKEPFREISSSPTHGGQVELIVSGEYLTPNDRILIIDDFLASAKTIMALVKVVEKSGATLVGIGAVIEKPLAGGRKLLADVKVPIESLAAIGGYEGEKVICQQLVTV